MTDETSRTPEQAIDDILEITLKTAFEDQLALLQEGYMHVEILRGLLERNYEVHAGAQCILRPALNSKKTGVYAEPRILSSKELKGDASKEDLEKRHYPDIRIVKPKLHVELKVFSEFGPKRYTHGLIDNDIRKVVNGHADAAVIVLPGRSYNVARGKGRKKKGKPASLKFDDLFPPDSMVKDGYLQTFLGRNLLVRLWAAPSPTKDSEDRWDFSARVAIAIIRAEQDMWPNFTNSPVEAQKVITGACGFLKRIFESTKW